MHSFLNLMLALSAVVIVGTIAMILMVAPAGGTKPMAGATVKIVLGEGHGSGVHIGNGKVLTAAHVVNEKGDYKVKTDTGKEYAAEVMWTNKGYDVALVYVDGLVAKRRELSCRAPDVGTPVVAIGNPLNVEFVKMRGHVIGPPQEVLDIKSVVALDMTTIPGMSGGPIVDPDGRIVGTVSAVMVVGMGPFSASIVGLGYAVPGSTICHVMARS